MTTLAVPSHSGGFRATAAVLRGSDASFAMEEVTLPALAAHEVLVRVVAAGMCHTDLLPRLGIAPLPVILGHEGSGIIEQVGAAVTTLRPGDHVVLSFDSCGQCPSCLSGHSAYCYDFSRHNTGASAFDGTGRATDQGREVVHHRWFGQSSFATYAIATARNTVRVDKDLPLHLLGPLGCGIQTGAGAMLNVLRPVPGERVAVFGGGAVGLAAVMAAKVAGARQIVVVEPNKFRRETALALGATHAVSPGDDVVEDLREICGWVDCSLDTTGAADAIRAGVRALRPLGRCGVVSWRSDEPVISPVDLVIEGRSLVGICEGGAEPAVFIPRMLELWKAGLFPFDQLIGTFDFSEINAAEAAIRGGSVIKPVLTM